MRAAIIGMGTWGQNLVNSVQGMSELIQFVAGATRTPARAREFSRRHGIPLQASFEAVLADPSIDAVVLATPHSMHSEQIVTAARAGKHIFTEKPLGLTTEHSAAAVQACAEHKVTLAVGYNWRFQPALQEIGRMLVDGRLGKLLHIFAGDQDMVNFEPCCARLASTVLAAGPTSSQKWQRRQAFDLAALFGCGDRI